MGTPEHPTLATMKVPPSPQPAAPTSAAQTRVEHVNDGGWSKAQQQQQQGQDDTVADATAPADEDDSSARSAALRGKTWLAGNSLEFGDEEALLLGGASRRTRLGESVLPSAQVENGAHAPPSAVKPLLSNAISQGGPAHITKLKESDITMLVKASSFMSMDEEEYEVDDYQSSRSVSIPNRTFPSTTPGHVLVGILPDQIEAPQHEQSADLQVNGKSSFFSPSPQRTVESQVVSSNGASDFEGRRKDSSPLPDNDIGQNNEAQSEGVGGTGETTFDALEPQLNIMTKEDGEDLSNSTLTANGLKKKKKKKK